jgi:transcriptional regulator with XRE-family HTH domain
MNKEKFIKLLGEQVYKVRTAKGLSLYRLGKEIGKSPSSIQRLEQGKMNASYIFLLEIANGLNVGVDELTRGLK